MLKERLECNLNPAPPELHPLVRNKYPTEHVTETTLTMYLESQLMLQWGVRLPVNIQPPGSLQVETAICSSVTSPLKRRHASFRLERSRDLTIYSKSHRCPSQQTAWYCGLVGHDISLTPRRSPVRARAEPLFLFAN